MCGPLGLRPGNSLRCPFARFRPASSRRRLVLDRRLRDASIKIRDHGGVNRDWPHWLNSVGQDPPDRWPDPTLGSPRRRPGAVLARGRRSCLGQSAAQTRPASLVSRFAKCSDQFDRRKDLHSASFRLCIASRDSAALGNNWGTISSRTCSSSRVRVVAEPWHGLRISVSSRYLAGAVRLRRRGRRRPHADDALLGVPPACPGGRGERPLPRPSTPRLPLSTLGPSARAVATPLLLA